MDESRLTPLFSESLDETVRLEEKISLYQALATLDETEKRVVESYFFHDGVVGRTVRDVARDFGCSHTRVENILQAALTKLRARLDDDVEETVAEDPDRRLKDARLPNFPVKETLRRYGLSLAGWLEIVARDVVDGSWVCPVCRVFPPTGRSVVDHRHVRNWKRLAPDDRKKYVRGVVCVTCNHFILTRYGTPAKFRNAADYLERNPT